MQRSKAAPEPTQGPSDKDGDLPELLLSPRSPPPPLTHSPWKMPHMIVAVLLVVGTLVIVSCVLRTQRSALQPVSSFSVVHTYSSSRSSGDGDQRVETTTHAVATQYAATTAGAAANAPRKGAAGWSSADDSQTQQQDAEAGAGSEDVPGSEGEGGQGQQQAADAAAGSKGTADEGSGGDGSSTQAPTGSRKRGRGSQKAGRRPAKNSSPLPPPTEVPADFDWRAYLNHYPSLRRRGIDTEVKAKAHWMHAGFRERRLYKPPRVTLRYTACGGLSNQQYSHIAALTLASHLNTSLVFPPALTRNSFASYFNMNPLLNRVSWRATPADSMWDIDYLRTFWAERGMEITLGPVDAPAPDLTRPETAFPTTLPKGYTSAQVARLRNVYLSSKSLAALLRQATDAIVATATNIPDREAPLLLDLPCTLFMIRTKTAPRIIKLAADSLHFHPRMHALADTIVSRLELPEGGFNGLHLRMEDDAQDWANILGGRDKLLDMYLEACEEAGFERTTPVYLASGLFTYGKMDAYKANIVKRLQEYSSKLQYKEEVLTKADVKDLTKEQLALLDFLVLARSSQFVGIGVSTFSHFLREYRSLEGKPKTTSVLVDGSVIGTDDLFNSCAYITDLPPPPGHAPPGSPSAAAAPEDPERRKQRQLLAHSVIPETCGF